VFKLLGRAKGKRVKKRPRGQDARKGSIMCGKQREDGAKKLAEKSRGVGQTWTKRPSQTVDPRKTRVKTRNGGQGRGNKGAGPEKKGGRTGQRDGWGFESGF